MSKSVFLFISPMNYSGVKLITLSQALLYSVERCAQLTNWMLLSEFLENTEVAFFHVLEQTFQSNYIKRNPEA